MPDGPQGITGLTGYIIQQPEAAPEDIHGGPADPYHANYGEQAEPYSWMLVQYGDEFHGPYGTDNQLLGDASDHALAAGSLEDDPTSDRTPYTHAAPWPKDPFGDGSTSPDNVANMRMQSAAIHASNLNASAAHIYQPTLEANNSEWVDFYSVDPGTPTNQEKPPSQVGISVGGYGSTDRNQSITGQNEYGFDSSHWHRRWAIQSIPGNEMWMKPGSRPMVKSFTGIRQFPIGEDTPFTGQDTTQAYSTEGAILYTTPPEYAAPPQPLTGPAFDPNEMGGPADTAGTWF